MIEVLRIQNLAVVEELEVEFGPGLNIITGETGAGKSILVKSLELLRGARATSHLVRTGAKSASVEALIELNGEQLVVRRTVSAAGRSRAYINGEMCTLAALQARAPAWLDISGQHEHHTLVDPTSHLAWLDRFAQVGGAREALGAAVDSARAAASALQHFTRSIQDRDDRMDLLRFQLGEIDQIAPKPGELDEVLKELDTLSHAAEIRHAADLAARALSTGEHSSVERIGIAHDEISAASQRDPALLPLLARLDSARLELEDIADELQITASRLLDNPGRLAELHDRERALSRLVRRHGTLDAALAHRQTLQAELDLLDEAELEQARLRRVTDDALTHASALARSLSATRQAHAKQLGEAVSAELHALGMGHARIEVELNTVPALPTDLHVDGARLGPTGYDRAEFLIAPNPGEQPRPLTKVASGGELSRALLALKQVLAGLGPVGSYVFDEVDTGVGGAIAEAIGKKLHTVATHHQVLCVTHQAVIAAWGDQHFRVAKQVVNGRTRTRIEELSEDERRAELARMLGGAEITEGVRQAAAELLHGARQ